MACDLPPGENARVGQPINDWEEGRRALREIGDIRAGTTSLFSSHCWNPL